MYSDTNDGYSGLINNTISGIKNKEEKKGNLVSKEIKKRDKQLSINCEEMKGDA